MKKLLLSILVILWACSCSTQKRNKEPFNTKNSKYKIHDEFKTYFDSCEVEGAIVIYDKKNQQWILSDTLNSRTESLPASTFKIINLLIALETKTIRDENEIVKWVGTTDTLKYGNRPEIYHDMSVKDAFKVSAGWVFIELAKKIGRENYKKYLSACNYGNLNLTENIADFWNFGYFAITPINQVEFIRNLYEGNLPFSKRNIEIVKNVMVAEETSNYTIRAKTGWTRENNTNTGWWVGYLEANENTYFFATRLLQDRNKDRDDFGNCRMDITKRIFYDLEFIKSNHEIYNKSKLQFNSIDHIPIVVTNLEEIKDVFKSKFHFTIKEGKVHEGIKNCFIKFQDGTYLEFIEPVDSSKSIGKYYTDFLKTRQGGTSLAIAVQNADLTKKTLKEKNISFSSDSSKIWRTLEPENTELFFIEYADKNWKEGAKNTIHLNTSTSLNSTYFLSDNMDEIVRKYKDLDFVETESGKILDTSYKLFKVGRSNFYILDGQKSGKLKKLLSSEKTIQGVCGFEIKVNSLHTFNKQIKQNHNVIFENKRTTIYLKDYNMFLMFTD